MEQSKNLRDLIYKNRHNFLEQGGMMKHEIEIQNLIGNMDEVAIKFEARWGCDRLPQLVNEDLRNKWYRQVDALSLAISDNDYPLLQALVPGTIRGYEAMEASALAAGCVSYDPVFWEVRLPETQRTVRIVQNSHDAAVAVQSGAEVWTLEEIGRVLDEKLRIYSDVKQVFPGAKVENVTIKTNWKDGDELPW